MVLQIQIYAVRLTHLKLHIVWVLALLQGELALQVFLQHGSLGVLHYSLNYLKQRLKVKECVPLRRAWSELSVEVPVIIV